jgi:hypothetical protein
LYGKYWPKLTDELNKSILIPMLQVEKMPKKLPALVRLKSNNKAEVIIKVIRRGANDETGVRYDVEWTPKGYMEENIG